MLNIDEFASAMSEDEVMRRQSAEEIFEKMSTGQAPHVSFSEFLTAGLNSEDQLSD